MNESIANPLTYFAVSMFWRAAERDWPIGPDVSELLRMGPFEELLRHYLLGEAAFPDRAALTVCISNRIEPPLASGFPKMYYDDTTRRFHRFYIPGVMFSLYLGSNAEQFMPLSLTSANLCWLSGVSDRLYMEDLLRFIRGNKLSPARLGEIHRSATWLKNLPSRAAVLLTLWHG